VILGRWTLGSSPIYVAMDLMSRLVSPYDLNPMGKNPLRAILAETINFERLARAPTKLFVTASSPCCAMRGEVRRKSLWRAMHRILDTAPLWILMDC
jgi:hypothetical protein